MKNIRNVMFILLQCLFVIAVSPVSADAETCEYDALNRLTKIIYDDGSIVTYSYDRNGNMLDTHMSLNSGLAVSSPEAAGTASPFLPIPTEIVPVPGIKPSEAPAGMSAMPPTVSTQAPAILATERGNIRICILDDSSGAAIQGVVVEIYCLGDYGMQRMTTDENGVIERSGLEAGVYQLVIVSVPSGYRIPANNSETLSVQAGRTSGAVFRLSGSAEGSSTQNNAGSVMGNDRQGSDPATALEGKRLPGGDEGASKNKDHKPPKVNLKAGKKYFKNKKVIVKDDSGIKTVRLNKKNIKIKKRAKKAVFRLKKCKVKKGWCKLIAIDPYGNKTVVKFRVR